MPGGGIERDEIPAAVHEDAPLPAVGPRRDAAVHEARSVRRLAREHTPWDRTTQSSRPVVASSATTRLYDVLRYSVSPIISGVA